MCKTYICRNDDDEDGNGTNFESELASMDWDNDTPPPDPGRFINIYTHFTAPALWWVPPGGFKQKKQTVFDISGSSTASAGPEQFDSNKIWSRPPLNDALGVSNQVDIIFQLVDLDYVQGSYVF